MARLDFDFTVRLRAFTLDVALSVGDETLALVGPSGAGKTTVVRVIAGLQRPDTGGVVVDDVVWVDRASGVDLPPERRRVGLVPQDYALFPHMTVAQNVAFAGDRRVGELLARLHVEHLASERPGALSGGERQRVALARALARDPAVLLLDEPLAALDAHTRLLVRDELRDILRDLAIPTLLITHDFADATSLADRIAVMDRGAVRQAGTAAALLAAPADGFVITFAGGNLLEGTADGHDVVLDDGTRIRAATEASGRVAVGIYPWELRAAAQPPGDGLNAIGGPLVVHGRQGARARLRIGRLVVECPQGDAEALDGHASAYATFPPEAVHMAPLR